MRPPTPRSLLVEHPALPQPFDRPESKSARVEVASLNRTERVRIAVQLVSVTALLADFELWPGRSVLRRVEVESTAHGPHVRLPKLPIPLSRVWSRLGGGDPAAERTRAAVLDAIAESTGLESAVFEHGEAEPGFFLDDVLSRLLAELQRPLDEVTARSLWMWRWSLPVVPNFGDTSLMAIQGKTAARRLGAAVWAEAVRGGKAATLEVARPGEVPTVVANHGGARPVRVLTGSFDDQTLASLMDRAGGRDVATIALGQFPEGWNPVSAVVFDPERLALHLTVAGCSPARRLRFVDRQTGRFDPFTSADRRWLTSSAAELFPDSCRRPSGKYRDLVIVAALASDGVPISRVLDLAGVTAEVLDEACDDRAVQIRQGRVLAPESVPFRVDPRHADLIDEYDLDDPRRLLHEALATGNPGAVIGWARSRLDELDCTGVRGLLTGLDTGALGPGVQVALAEACLGLADIHGARRALAGLSDEISRPWMSWLRLIDRAPEFEVECPRPIDVRHAPRACAEIGLVGMRRASLQESKSIEDSQKIVREALHHLDGTVRSWVEIRLAARVEPHLLDDPQWRQSSSGGHPELMGLIAFERSVRADREGHHKLARRHLRRVMAAERSPGRLALMQLNLGVLEADLGCHQAAEALFLGAFRLFQSAGFQHRGWDALYNLAVTDIDQLRVDRASARLEALREANDTLFLQAERARLALAMGELDLFQSRLRGLPEVSENSTAQVVEALSFLYGVEALFFDSATAAVPLLQAGGEEGVVWLEFVGAILGANQESLASAEDGWGLRRAATLVHAVRGTGPDVRVDWCTKEKLELREAFSVALCCRLGMHIGRDLRLRALVILDDRGLRGWAARLRWDSIEVENLFRGLSDMVRNHGLVRLDDRTIQRILVPLGIRGLAIRSTRSGRELSRVGEGEPYSVHRRGSLELVPLGGRPVSAAAWNLVGEILELTNFPGGNAEMNRCESEVRIDGVSPAAEKLRDDVLLHAGPEFTVLIHGETGSGKEVVARELHRLSGRSGELISINVAAIPVNLLEAELFGSVKGAFTGAERSRRGLVAAADGGTLFLDEVGDLDVVLQVKLLRFLESREIRAVGSDRTELTDVRVICATHRNLKRLVREGRFRDDLFFRIGLAEILVPPLRERAEDILILKEIFEEEASRRHKMPILPWTAAAVRSLMDHRWPGNVRELKATVEVAMARASGEMIRPDHLRLTQQSSAPRGSWEGALAGFKRRFLHEVLARHQGNRSRASRELGISRQALLYQIKKLGLKDV